jgi:diguanylate cyclase (GGDEF)-like protein
MNLLKGRLSSWLIGQDPAMRRALSLMLIGATHYMLNALLACWAIRAGVMAPEFGRWMVLTLAVGPWVFYTLARSGFSRRFDDPAMVVAQCLYCVAAIVLGYQAVRIQFRGAVLGILPLVLMFGQFSLQPRQIAFIGRAAIAALAGITVLGWLWRPGTDRQVVTTDGLQLLYTFGILIATIRVAQVVSRMRHNLERSRADLADALARMRDMASHDELTGLANRRRMQEQLAEELKRERRGDQPLSLALLDLDHFKRINDTYGHQTGDDVLRRFAEIAKTALREVDMLARWGGEEFLLLCPGSTAEQAATGLDRLRQQLAASTLLPRQPQVTVTFSAGTVQYLPGETIEEATARADHALYEAKASGRDRTVQGS